jgi:pimeloyl-ACP methyl ester carboxylesterase
MTAKNSLQADMVYYVQASLAQLPAQAQEEQNLINSSQEKVSEVYSQVQVYLDEWADVLHKATQDYQEKILNADNYISAGDMYDIILHMNEPGFKMANSNKPISIVPFKMADGTTRLLVYISGTDAFHSSYADSIFRSFQNGMNSGADSQYLKDVASALSTYLDEHPEFANPQITLMGYSVGGMVAQELTSQLNSPNINQVITVGSPITNVPVDYSPTSSVDYKLYMGTGDLIPLLSTHEIDQSQLTGDRLDRVSQAYTKLTWDEKLHQYFDPNNQYDDSVIPVSDLPFVKDSIAEELKNIVPNHVLYAKSNFLENQDISTFDGAPQIGDPEYFPVTDFSKK